jgi:acetyl esterase/lipase
VAPAEHFVGEDSYHDPVLSPDGKHIAVITTMKAWIGTVPTLAILRLQDNQIITAIKMDRFEVPQRHWWVSNTRLVVTKARDFGDNEKPTPTGEILTVELDGKGQDYLYGYFRRKGSDRGFGVVSALPPIPNGRFYMTAFDIGGKRSALYEVDSVTGERTALLSLPYPGLGILLDHQSQPRFATGYTSDARVLYLKYDANTLGWEIDRSSSAELRVEPKAFTADDSAMYALVSESGKPQQLVRQDIATGARTVVASDPVFDVELVSAGANSADAFGWRLTGGAPRLHYLEPASPLALLHQGLSAKFPGSFVRLLNSTHNNAKVLFEVSSGDDPGTYYIYDAAANRADMLFTNLEKIEPDLMGERKPISFTARDGLQLHGFLTFPRHRPAGPLPLVLIPHGGPHGISDSWSFDPYAQFVASRGYAALQVNYRGSGGRGEAFIKSGFGQWGRQIQDDLADGVQWAIAEGVADKGRVCVFGISFGAYSAMMLPVRSPQMFRCAVGYAGVYDLEMLLRDKDKEDKRSADAVWRKFLGTDAEQHRRDSPVLQAGQIKLPVLLIHGSADDITPLAQGKAMRAALSDAGNPPEYLQVSSEGHGFFLPANKLKVLKLLENFLARHIGVSAPQ